MTVLIRILVSGITTGIENGWKNEDIQCRASFGGVIRAVSIYFCATGPRECSAMYAD